MKVANIKDVVEREPFRPFIVRLNNGAQYAFRTPREIGATRSYNIILFFGEPRPQESTPIGLLK
jgi:hypothetical protein